MAEAADSQPDRLSLNHSLIVDDGNSNLPLPTLSLLSFSLSLGPVIFYFDDAGCSLAQGTLPSRPGHKQAAHRECTDG